MLDVNALPYIKKIFNMSNFNKNVGKPISKVDEQKAIDNWTKASAKASIKTKSNFFGADIIQKLLNISGSVGISIVHGLDNEGNMKPMIFATDKDGKLIVPTSSEKSTFSAAADLESDDDSGGYNASMTCPPYCTR